MCQKAGAFTSFSDSSHNYFLFHLLTVSCYHCSAASRRVIGAAAEVSQPKQSAVEADMQGDAEASPEPAPHVTHESQVLEPLQRAVRLYGPDPKGRHVFYE